MKAYPTKSKKCKYKLKCNKEEERTLEYGTKHQEMGQNIEIDDGKIQTEKKKADPMFNVYNIRS